MNFPKYERLLFHSVPILLAGYTLSAPRVNSRYAVLVATLGLGIPILIIGYLVSEYFRRKLDNRKLLVFLVVFFIVLVALGFIVGAQIS
ncbi:hypothetical protein FHQ08_11570 [Lactobacillus sp. CC-MHH1034]|nr:hypothetical protein [Agrilactobacillus fermenti]MCD2257326.1 hypothetical protein [Agrilactobacillus fermenti]